MFLLSSLLKLIDVFLYTEIYEVCFDGIKIYEQFGLSFFLKTNVMIKRNNLVIYQDECLGILDNLAVPQNDREWKDS